jgi:raffinose/stachyose/melibiose transport system substrate-binding protein
MHKSKFIKMLILFLSVALVVSFSFIGCKEEAVEEVAPAEEAMEEEAAPAEEEAAEKIELVAWDSYTEANESPAIDKLFDKFNQTHDDIEAVRAVYNWDDLQAIIQTTLGGGTGPDVVYYDTGPAFAGRLIEAGLIMDLTDVYKEMGWDERFLPQASERLTYDGKIYGVCNEIEFLTTYYNKDIFEELGVSEPKNFEEFEQICEKAKAAGYTPIAFGAADAWSPPHMWNPFFDNILGKEKMENLLLGDGSWDDPDVIRSLQIPFVDWMDAGYLGTEPTAINYIEMLELFLSGDYPMEFTGSWQMGQIDMADKDFDAGFFYLPSIDGKPTYETSFVGSGYLVNVNTDHPEAAYEFIDFMLSEETASIWVLDVGIVPTFAIDPSELGVGPLMSGQLEYLKTTKFDGYMAQQFVGPQWNEKLLSGVQALLLKQETPEELAKELQSIWEIERPEI